jgi:hypothetical protein
MTEQELRALVREAIARQISQPRPAASAQAPAAFFRHDLSYSQFAVPSGPDGTCVIEPSVMCNHCGYCKSYGH